MIPEYLDQNCLVYQSDWADFIDMLHAESVQMVWTSPPGGSLDQSQEYKDFSQMEAIELCAAVAHCVTRALADGGVIVFNLGHRDPDGIVSAIAKRTHLHFGGYIIDLEDVDSTIVMFQKGEPKFNEDAPLSAEVSEVGLVAGFIESCTRPGEVVVDPFCGSGVVLEAAVNANRVAIVNDINPEAVAATIARYKENCARQ